MQIYLSYPKPPVLDMKWKNRDINVVEQAIILKFSTLDNIRTPLRLFELFFDNELIDVSVGYTRFYGHGEKAGTSLILLMKHFAYSRHATA